MPDRYIQASSSTVTGDEPTLSAEAISSRLSGREPRNDDRHELGRTMNATPNWTYAQVRQDTHLHKTDQTLRNYKKAATEGKYVGSLASAHHYNTGKYPMKEGTDYPAVKKVVRP